MEEKWVDNVSGIKKCGHRVHNFQDRSNQVMTGKVEPGHVESGHVESGQVEPGPVEIGRVQLRHANGN